MATEPNAGHIIPVDRNELHQVLDAVEQIKDQARAIAEYEQGVDARIAAVADPINAKLREIEARAKALDDALPRGRKLYVAGGTPDRDEALRDFGRLFTVARRMHRGDKLPGEYGDYSAYTRAQTEGTDTAGGIMVPTDVYPGVIRIVKEKSVIRQIARTISMTRDIMNVPVVNTGPAVSWPGEATAPSETSFALHATADAQLDSNTMTAFITVSRELEEDTLVSLEPVIGELFAEAVAKEENLQAFSSTTPFTGVIQTTGIGSYSMPTGSTNYSTVAHADLVKTLFSVDVNVIGDCQFVTHPLVFQHIVNLKDSNGRPIYAQYAQSGASNLLGSERLPTMRMAQPGMLLGLPLYLTTTFAATSAATTAFLIVGDFSKFAFGDRRQLAVEWDDSVYFTSRRRAVMVWERIALKPLKPGAFAVCKTA